MSTEKLEDLEKYQCSFCYFSKFNWVKNLSACSVADAIRQFNEPHSKFPYKFIFDDDNGNLKCDCFLIDDCW